MPKKKRRRSPGRKKAPPPPEPWWQRWREAVPGWWGTGALAEKWPRHGGWILLGLALLCLILALIRRPSSSYGAIWEDFSGEKALAHVQALVDFGPRPAASEAIKKTRAYIRHDLETNGWRVEEQRFTDQTPRGPVEFVNLIARRPNESKKLFLLGSHYDTKMFDSIRFVGANDGGSSTGALLEMARVLNKYPGLAAQMELVFFDGEEAYEHFSRTDGLYGSRHFAQQLLDQKRVSKYGGGIVWDMMGDRNLTITMPPDSPADLASGIFAAADALKMRKHFTYLEDGMLDDHTPLNEAGIPTIDLIDFDYPPWHTSQDTMDKLSAESLQIVGRVTLHYLVKSALQ